MIVKLQTICGAVALVALGPGSAKAEQFSVQCPFQGYYHVTVDTVTGRVVYESPAGSALRGRVDKTIGMAIHFRILKTGNADFEGVLATERERITWIGIPGDPTRLGRSDECRRVELRPILSKYNLISPY
jgi:hypothetical protein